MQMKYNPLTLQLKKCLLVQENYMHCTFSVEQSGHYLWHYCKAHPMSQLKLSWTGLTLSLKYPASPPAGLVPEILPLTNKKIRNMTFDHQSLEMGYCY